MRPRRAFKIFWTIVIAPVALVLLMVLLAICGAFGTLPSFEELENPRSNIAAEIISSDGKTIGNYFIENRSYTSYAELSPSIVAALISTEDVRFYSHSGIDFLGLTRVAIKSLLLWQNDQGGGSTVSQQLAKNLFPRDTTSRSFLGRKFRLVTSKLKEWVTATKLEYNYTKEEILAMYLSTVQYGSNAFGIKSAARTFFDKEPSEINVPEAATLVGLLKAPSYYSPVSNPERSLRRRNTVISRMASADFISDDKADEYKNTAINLTYHPISNNEGTATYFREMLRLYLTATTPERTDYSSDWEYTAAKKRWDHDPLYGWCAKNQKADGSPYNLYRDGLKIYTTINSKMQQYAEEALLEQMSTQIQPAFDRQRKNYGNKIFYNIDKSVEENIMNSAIMNSERGRVMKKEGATREQIFKAFAHKEQMRVFTYRGDRDTTLTPRDSILHSKAIMRSGFMAMDPTTGYVQAYVGGPSFRTFKYDMVRQGRRQIGSTVKPFIYTFAFDFLGYNPCTMVPNLPVSIENGSGDAWSPKEAGKVEYDGVLHPLRWGLANSRNNYSAWIMKQSSPAEVVSLIHKMGITSYIDPVYAVAVGTPEVSLYEMVGAFSTFANRGVHTEPFFVTRIEDRQGNVLSSFSPSTTEAISEKTAYTMLSMLQSNISAGTGGRLRYQFNIMGEVGGKTGTTDNNSDAWFMCVAPRVAAGAWVGGEERSIHLVSRGEGSVAALPIVGIFLNKVYKDKSLGISPSDKFMLPIGGVSMDCDEGVNAQNTTLTKEGKSVANQEQDEFFD
ncbi:MAG: transglycosylase domain-containing protein [Mucinivorans sp.]